METTPSKKEQSFSIINLTQGSDEWLEYRRSRIGSSDVPALMGVSPYAHANDVLKSKLGFNKTLSDHTKRIFQDGHDFEARFRDQIQGQFNGEITAPVIESKKNDRFFTSIDLFNEEHQFYGEVKSTVSKDILSQVAANKVPDHFYYQMNWTLGILGWDSGMLYVINRETSYGYELKVNFDPMIFAEQERIAEIFLNQLDEQRSILAPDQIALANIAAANKKIKRVQKMIDDYSERVKLEAEKLLGQSVKIEGAGISIERIERKGSIDYSAVPELKNIDLEKYRKPTSTFVTIKEVKQKKETTK